MHLWHPNLIFRVRPLKRLFFFVAAAQKIEFSILCDVSSRYGRLFRNVAPECHFCNVHEKCSDPENPAKIQDQSRWLNTQKYHKFTLERELTTTTVFFSSMEAGSFLSGMLSSTELKAIHVQSTSIQPFFFSPSPMAAMSVWKVERRVLLPHKPDWPAFCPDNFQ